MYFWGFKDRNRTTNRGGVVKWQLGFRCDSMHMLVCWSLQVGSLVNSESLVFYKGLIVICTLSSACHHVTVGIFFLISSHKTLFFLRQLLIRLQFHPDGSYWLLYVNCVNRVWFFLWYRQHAGTGKLRFNSQITWYSCFNTGKIAVIL